MQVKKFLKKSFKEQVTDVLKNILIMLKNRKLIHENEIKKRHEEMVSLVKKYSDNFFKIKIGDTYLIIQIFKLKTPTLKNLLTMKKLEFSNNKIRKIIITNNKKISLSRKKKSNDLDDQELFNVEFFTMNYFISDKYSHILQSKFILLSQKEQQDILREYKIDNLRIIQSDDIMARYFALKKNQIIQVIRPNIMSGKSVDYLVCK